MPRENPPRTPLYKGGSTIYGQALTYLQDLSFVNPAALSGTGESLFVFDINMF
jgi:hypothetical protein